MRAVAAVLVAAGQSRRMEGADKMLLPLGGKSVLERSVRALSACPEIDVIVIVAQADKCEETLARFAAYHRDIRVVAGGDSRGASVWAGLCALKSEADMVLIHDAARPFVTAEILRDTLACAREKGSGVAGVMVKDTIKVADGQGRVTATPERSALWQVQTPQTFRFTLIYRAYERALARLHMATDDAMLLEEMGEPVYMVQSSYDNIKITTKEDIAVGEAILRAHGESVAPAMRVGQGYDAHRFTPGRALVIGGVTIPHEQGLLGHSDADVLLHAVMDALLGAAALGDIGVHFPDSDGRYRGAESLQLLEQVGGLLRGAGYQAVNVHGTVIAEAPKMRPHIAQMEEKIARVLRIGVQQVSVSATTTEGMGFTGCGEGIAASAVARISATHPHPRFKKRQIKPLRPLNCLW